VDSRAAGSVGGNMGNGANTEKWVSDKLADNSGRIRNLEIWREGVIVQLSTIAKLQWAIIGVVIAGAVANIVFGS